MPIFREGFFVLLVPIKIIHWSKNFQVVTLWMRKVSVVNFCLYSYFNFILQNIMCKVITTK